MKKVIVFIIFIFLYGCSGTVYTVQDPQFKAEKEGEDKRIKGVLFYGYKPVTKKITLDRIRNLKTGNITHTMYTDPSSPNYCRPATKEVKTIEADYDTVYSVYYEPGLFETNKFSVQLEKGTLKAVNSESTPGLKVAVESLQGLVDVFQDIKVLEMAVPELELEKALPCSSNK